MSEHDLEQVEDPWLDDDKVVRVSEDLFCEDIVSIPEPKGTPRIYISSPMNDSNFYASLLDKKDEKERIYHDRYSYSVDDPSKNRPDLVEKAQKARVKKEKYHKRPPKIVNRNRGRPPPKQGNQRQFYGAPNRKR